MAKHLSHIFLYSIFIGVMFFVPAAYAKSTAQEVYENVKDSIGTIYSIDEEDKEKNARGSGVAIEKDLVVTNCHVALSGNFLIIKINKETLLGRLLYYNKKKDVCLIQVSGSPLKSVNMRPSRSVEIGEEVFAIGNPEGHEKTISRGIISNKENRDGVELLQTDASISHGSSGGGLFDSEGNLIGITTEADERGENIAFAIPTETIIDVVGGSKKSSETTATKSTSDANNSQLTEEKYEELTRIGYYGEDEVALMKWRDRCFIGIVGRYNNKPTSLAIWFPDKPNGLYIFSHKIRGEDAIEFFNWINQAKDVSYPNSKSFVYFDEDLYPLPIITVNKVKQRAYIFLVNKPLTEDLISLDYFLGQFYHYTDSSGMTTIKFGLSGFTEAYGAYKKLCK